MGVGLTQVSLKEREGPPQRWGGTPTVLAKGQTQDADRAWKQRAVEAGDWRRDSSGTRWGNGNQWQRRETLAATQQHERGHHEGSGKLRGKDSRRETSAGETGK